MKLIVKIPFDVYCRGEEITEPAAIRIALASNPGHVLKVGDVDAPEPVEQTPEPPQEPEPSHEESEPEHPAD